MKIPKIFLLIPFFSLCVQAIGDRVVYGQCADIKTSDAKDCELIGRSMCGRPPKRKDPCPEYEYDAASKICTYCF